MKITASNHKEQNIFEHHLKAQFPSYLIKCIDTINGMSKIIISFQCFNKLVTSLSNWDSSMSMKDTLYKKRKSVAMSCTNTCLFCNENIIWIPNLRNFLQIVRECSVSKCYQCCLSILQIPKRRCQHTKLLFIQAIC